MKKCKYCQSEIDKKAKICPHCRKKQNNLIQIFISILAIFIVFLIIIIIFSNDETINFDDYALLNPQEFHNDYIDNEISAADKYEDNYYYFTGKVYKVEEFWSDNYLKIQYKYDKDNSKLIELDAYFNNVDDLKSVKKDDVVTVYCRFKHRGIEEFMNVITTYTFKECKFKQQ